MEIEQTECSETLAYKIQPQGNYPEGNIQHSEHDEKFEIEENASYLAILWTKNLSAIWSTMPKMYQNAL